MNKIILIILLASASAIGWPAAQANPIMVADLPLPGGKAVFEISRDTPEITECDIPGKILYRVVSTLVRDDGDRQPLGIGCALADIDGNIRILIRATYSGNIEKYSIPYKQFVNLENSPEQAPTFVGSAIDKEDDGTLILYQIFDTLDPKCPVKGGRAAQLLGGKSARFACWVKKDSIVYLWTDEAKKDEQGRMVPDIALKFAGFDIEGDSSFLN